MTARPGLVLGELGHERDADLQLLGHFLQALFINGVVVRHGEDVGVTDVEFVLAGPPFPLGALDRNAGSSQVPAHGAVKELLARSLQRVIVLDIPAHGVQVRVAFLRAHRDTSW